MRLDIITGKHVNNTNTLILKVKLLCSQEITEELKEEKKYLETNDNENNDARSVG